ncbi:fibrinogen C domain-containing protein 1-like isoform X1 [Zophobas morio]|uniref:fibrinogen C domain-containing protein 1-like isoform X1 n=1 Tax=Zophobas morio TaxID=2755281 RepID=UPI0030832F13
MAKNLKIIVTIFLQIFVAKTFSASTSEFVAVSTTKPEVPTLSDFLAKIETRIEYTQTLKENTQRLQALERQNTQLQTTLDSVNLHLNSIQTLLEKLANAKTPTQTKSFPTSCKDIKDSGNKVSGMYLIQPKYSSESFMVLCDMDTSGGGWAYFLSRFDGSQNFYLNWTDYKNGFGSLSGEFWLGLEALHQLTGFDANELLVELEDFEGGKVHAAYNAFAVGSEDEGYPMKVLGSYSGTAGDSLRYQAGMKFTTLDRDQDLRPGNNCAAQEKGSWWYNSCTMCNPTARYLRGNVTEADRWQIVYWDGFRGSAYSLKKVGMMVRPRGRYSSNVLPVKK